MNGLLSGKSGSVILFAVYIVLTALGSVLIKYGGATTKIEIGGGSFSFTTNGKFIIGLIIYVCSFILWIVVMRRFDLTYIVPLSYGCAFVAITILSRFILEEKIKISTIIGFVLILSGVIVCVVGKNSDKIT